MSGLGDEEVLVSKISKSWFGSTCIRSCLSEIFFSIFKSVLDDGNSRDKAGEILEVVESVYTIFYLSVFIINEFLNWISDLNTLINFFI